MNSLFELYNKISTEKDYRLKCRMLLVGIVVILCPFSITKSELLHPLDNLPVLHSISDYFDTFCFILICLALFQVLSGILFWPLSFFVLKISSIFYNFFSALVPVWVDLFLIALALSELLQENFILRFYSFLIALPPTVKWPCILVISLSFFISFALAIDWIQRQRKKDYKLLH